MKCPRCETAALDEREREGITVDVCTGCRGIWLDRGELEKLIARAARELDELEGARSPAPAPAAPAAQAQYQPPPHEYPRTRRDSTPPHGVRIEREHGYQRGSDYDDDYRRRHGYHKKRSFLDILGDVFD